MNYFFNYFADFFNEDGYASCNQVAVHSLSWKKEKKIGTITQKGTIVAKIWYPQRELFTNDSNKSEGYTNESFNLHDSKLFLCTTF